MYKILININYYHVNKLNKKNNEGNIITLLASISDFFTAIIPNILKIFTDHNDKKHELAMMDHQIKIQKSGINQRLEKIKINSESAQIKTLYNTFQSDII